MRQKGPSFGGTGGRGRGFRSALTIISLSCRRVVGTRPDGFTMKQTQYTTTITAYKDEDRLFYRDIDIKWDGDGAIAMFLSAMDDTGDRSRPDGSASVVLGYSSPFQRVGWNCDSHATAVVLCQRIEEKMRTEWGVRMAFQLSRGFVCTEPVTDALQVDLDALLHRLENATVVSDKNEP